MKVTDYYQTLGVRRDADQETIKRAFRKLARANHPDTNKGDPEAESRFKAINEAYTVLSDPEKRRKYDRFGKDWERFTNAGGNPQDFNWQQWGTGGPRRGMSPEDIASMFGGQQMGGQGFSTFFEHLFGMGGPGSMGGPSAARRAPPRPPRREVKAELTLEEAAAGTSRKVRLSGGDTVAADIPRGVRDGSLVRLRGSGEGGESDLHVRIGIKPHPVFQRQEDDLLVDVEVDLYTAVLGGEVRVPTLEGPVQMRIRPGTQSHTRIALAGKGMPQLKQSNRRGRLIARVRIRIPQDLSPEQTALFRQLQDAQGAK